MRIPRLLALPLALCAVLAADVAFAQALPGSRPNSMPAEHPGADSPDTWAVRLRPGSDADAVAAHAGARNLGQIAKLADTYLFHLAGGAAQSALADARLRSIDGIVWQQQQIPRQRYPRAITDPQFPNQWHLVHGALASVDANVQPAWDLGADGTGVVIAVADTGVAHAHPDLAPNYRADLSWDFNDNDADPDDTHGHGTSAAGVAAAADDGASCGVGAAYNAQIAGLRLIMDTVTDATEAEALAWHTDAIRISSNSWGPSDDGDVVEGPGPLTRLAMAEAAEGFGTIWVWAAGNGGTGDDVGADGYASMRQTIAVAGVTDAGGVPWYGEAGSALLVAAPTNGGARGITTTNRNGGCTSSFGGTSSAAPLAAGVVALMLDARPQLSWRDVQHVLVHSAVKVNPAHANWIDNAAGLHFNDFYGFGMIDAGAAVELAAEWDLVGPALYSASALREPAIAIPQAAAGGGATDSVVVDSDIVATEHVEVVFSATHQRRGDIEVTLISPSGTAIRLLRSRMADTSAAGFSNWKFSANTFWDEDPNGTWTLRVRDARSGSTGTWQDWQLIVHGTGSTGLQPEGSIDGDGDYSEVEVGTSSATSTFMLTSTGDAALVVSADPVLDDATHFVVGDFTCAAAADLGTDGNCSVDVHFAPQAEGSHATTLRIATNAGGFALPLSGTGTVASGQFTGTTTYADIRLGHLSDSQTFTLTSNGTAALIVADDTALDDSTHFDITSNTCTEDNNLGEAAECSIAVVFAPDAIGPVSTTLRVTTNAGEYALTLSGEGIDPQGTLNGGVMFGDGVVGDNGATHTFTLASSGTTALLIESTALVDNSDHFEIVSNGCTGGINLGTTNTCTIDVRFSPDMIGEQSTILRAMTNAGELALELVGTGIDPHAALSGEVAFGESAVGGIGTTHTFTFASSGTTALLLEGTAALDSGAHFEIITNDCTGGTDLGTTGACTIEVRFLPGETGAQTTTLRVLSNAGEHTAELSGTGIDPQATLTGSPAFDDTLVGSTSTNRLFTLSSSGTTPLIVDSLAALDDATHFSIVTNSCAASANLGLSNSCTVRIRFAPVARGALATTLRIATNAGEFTVGLTGNGTVPVALFLDDFEAPDPE